MHNLCNAKQMAATNVWTHNMNQPGRLVAYYTEPGPKSSQPLKR